MIELIITLCLQQAPAVCVEHTLFYRDEHPAAMCHMSALPKVAEHAYNFSKTSKDPLVLRKWKCRPAKLNHANV